ncbi:MAG TPA: hypothetical protein VH298_11010 [Jatrophihabitans sp.]|nr:hypothetical protein [Jatrophihabitans sp.]
MTIPVVAGGLVFVTPGAADAVTCGQSWTNKDTTGGRAIYQPKNGYTYPLHTGIYGDCRVTWWISDGEWNAYDCYRINSRLESWTHVHVIGVEGWVWDDYLIDGGSTRPC